MTDSTELHDTTQAPDPDATDSTPEHLSEDEALEAFDRLTEGEEYSRQFPFSGKGVTIVFDASPIEDRKERWDYLSKLPGVSADDPEDIDKAQAKPDGEAMGAIEDMVLSSFSHPHYGDREIETLVRKQFTDEVLFKAFTEIVEMSSELGNVDEFHLE